MDKSKLTPPIFYNGDSIEEIIDSAYEDFKNGFMNKDKRPKYKGKFIFFNMNKNIKVMNKDAINEEDRYTNITLTKAERFYHIISIDKKEYIQVFPCYNTPEYESCQVECETIRAKGEFIYLSRVECLYRLYRIHRISEVIELANADDKHIDQWVEIELDKKKNKIRKIYIRYTYGNDDYIVILKEKVNRDKSIYYEFITAFPVFLKRNKDQYKEAYNSYKRNGIK
ncbi:hypothetical protein [uncultured Romboutsia sp.]|uniref:hypothetical protein n=1 Tax=uncultured Romboutsia sp. TaxID=1505656 RepID=UPI00266BF2E3|nr:hypothetical protein [uncultured Romboutsia sp.]